MVNLVQTADGFGGRNGATVDQGDVGAKGEMGREGEEGVSGSLKG